MVTNHFFLFKKKVSPGDLKTILGFKSSCFMGLKKEYSTWGKKNNSSATIGWNCGKSPSHHFFLKKKMKSCHTHLLPGEYWKVWWWHKLQIFGVSAACTCDWWFPHLPPGRSSLWIVPIASPENKENIKCFLYSRWR